MASGGNIRSRRLNAITRKIPNGRMPRGIIVVGIPREYVSMAYRRQKAN